MDLKAESYMLNDAINELLDEAFPTNNENEVLNQKNECYRYVIEERYGMNGNIKSLKVLSDEFHLTRERVRQIEIKALNKLQHPTRSNKTKDFIE